MASFDPQQIADWTGGCWTVEPVADITGLCFDARQVEPGDCFVALNGGDRDGHNFIEQAALGGAVAALVESQKSLDLPQLKVGDTLSSLGAIGHAVRSLFNKPVVGVTGSCGKTSTKEMLRGLFGGDCCHATAGNWNNRIGVPMTLFGLNADVQNFAVVEAGINQPNEMRHLGKMIQADLSIITNIGPAHLELLGSLDHIAREKSLLAHCAKPDSSVIIPANVLRYHNFLEMAERAIVLVSDEEQLPDVEILDAVHYEIESLATSGKQRLRLSGESYEISSASRGMAINAALAITAAYRLGVSSSVVRQKIEEWRPSRDRGRVEQRCGNTFYVDCYNANPASMLDSLIAFQLVAPQGAARLYILGAMNELGDFAQSEHEKIGQQLKLNPHDYVCFVGPVALTDAFIRGAQASGAGHRQLICVENVDAIQSIVADFEGAIFLKGSRSHQLENLLT